MKKMTKNNAQVFASQHTNLFYSAKLELGVAKERLNKEVAPCVAGLRRYLLQECVSLVAWSYVFVRRIEIQIAGLFQISTLSAPVH